jgi:hypothetical protein
MAHATPDEVMAALAHNDQDPDGVWPQDWFHDLERYDLLSELVLIICKNRHISAYTPLVQRIEACIEAQQGERV